MKKPATSRNGRATSNDVVRVAGTKATAAAT